MILQDVDCNIECGRVRAEELIQRSLASRLSFVAAGVDRLTANRLLLPPAPPPLCTMVKYILVCGQYSFLPILQTAPVLTRRLVVSLQVESSRECGRVYVVCRAWSCR
jgi:hypothetical protein